MDLSDPGMVLVVVLVGAGVGVPALILFIARLVFDWTDMSMTENEHPEYSTMRKSKYHEYQQQSVRFDSKGNPINPTCP